MVACQQLIGLSWPIFSDVEGFLTVNRPQIAIWKHHAAGLAHVGDKNASAAQPERDVV